MAVGSIVDESPKLAVNLGKRRDGQGVAFEIAEDEDALEQLSGERQQLRHGPGRVAESMHQLCK